ncbi:MAG: hypothetical protein ABIW49_11050 [Knoellia sp.]
MAKYLVLYQADASAAEQMANATPEQAQAGMDAWMQWGERAASAIVDMGSPLAPVGGADSVGGYSVLEAEDDDALQAALEGHPHLQMGTIDVHRFLPIQGM